jgi:hypothetical protein
VDGLSLVDQDPIHHAGDRNGHCRLAAATVDDRNCLSEVEPLAATAEVLWREKPNASGDRRDDNPQSIHHLSAPSFKVCPNA